MVKEAKLNSIISAAGTLVSIVVVLLGTAVGWGTLKTRISALELKTLQLEEKMEKINDSKVDKEDYKDAIQFIRQDSHEIKQDIKEILKRMSKK
jgi:hypothetical protein